MSYEKPPETEFQRYIRSSKYGNLFFFKPTNHLMFQRPYSSYSIIGFYFPLYISEYVTAIL